MLVVADLSGIQDYLFQVQDAGGKQARSLRFRSLYIQLIAEAIGVRLLRAGGLSEDREIFCSAGKIAIDGAGLNAEKLNAIHQEARAIESWLRDQTHARLRLSMAIHEGPGESIKQQCEAANKTLVSMKLRGWSSTAAEQEWRPDQLIALPPDDDQEARRDAKLGQQVVQSSSRFLVMEQTGDGVDVAGLRAHFVSSQPTNGRALYVRNMADVMRHVPMADGQAIEFVDLARHARGAPMLGVLKADADSLGEAIRRCLNNADDLNPLKTFSERLDGFFAGDLDQQMRNAPRWSKLYTVFSGGDDLLLVGPWDIVLDFAGHLQRQFAQRFKTDQLTISAGVAIIKPKFPIRLAAQQGEDLLETAKTGTKNQCAALGGLWKWSDHERIIDAGKQLADWVDTDVIDRGWLHTLLQLTLLRRGAIPGTPQHEQVMATARLSYHVARNWPKATDPGEKGKARRWIDNVLIDFDKFNNATDPITIHLPAIIRYAMLATRSQGDIP